MLAFVKRDGKQEGTIMKLRILAFAFLISLATLSRAQAPAANPHPEIPDAVTADGKHYTVEIENQFVRVLRIHYGPNETGNMHNHPHSVTVFLTDGKLKMTFPDGKSMVGTVPAGAAVFEEAGPHQPENLLDKPFEAVRIELKSPTEGETAALQSAWAADDGRMSDKFSALAGAMSGK
jgi:quercetin dioxygenase-like cupin family protein